MGLVNYEYELYVLISYEPCLLLLLGMFGLVFFLDWLSCSCCLCGFVFFCVCVYLRCMACLLVLVGRWCMLLLILGSD